MKFLKKRKLNKEININSFSSIERKMMIEGKNVPAFICNGGSYFFTNLSVYSDGIIDAWGSIDLDFFKKKLQTNWVATNVPNNKEISIHHLGEYIICKANWIYNNNSFYDYIMGIIKEMNPNLQNLYNFYGSDVVKKGKVNYSKLPTNGNPIKYDKEDDFSRNKLTGRSFSVFKKEKENTYYLCNISVFSDGNLKIDNIPNNLDISLNQFKNLVKEGELITNIKKGQKVIIYGLGDFEILEINYSNEIEELIYEIEDTISELNSIPTSSQICKNIYKEYIENPTIELKNELKKSYEKVPSHMRIYILGDMDTKDIPIRMIIYGENEIENWSHYIMAKNTGAELPSINVPKPNDKD